ncbi:MAG TPA: hypothetical protein VLT90_16040 [Terriglobales bacterium]|nr:hypothetical protein [Terriglobales bacterium]
MGFVSQIADSRGVRALLCAALVACVLIVVVAPSIDLLPTVLRVPRVNSSLFIPLAAFALMALLRTTDAGPGENVAFRPTTLQLFSSLVPGTCELRC